MSEEWDQICDLPLKKWISETLTAKLLLKSDVDQASTTLWLMPTYRIWGIRKACPAPTGMKWNAWRYTFKSDVPKWQLKALWLSLIITCQMQPYKVRTLSSHHTKGVAQLSCLAIAYTENEPVILLQKHNTDFAGSYNIVGTPSCFEVTSQGESSWLDIQQGWMFSRSQSRSGKDCSKTCSILFHYLPPPFIITSHESEGNID